jgi:very-short-patch-repair endonuclease
MILVKPQKIKVKIMNMTKRWYEEKGYDVQNKKELMVDAEDLQNGSHVKVKVQCDYCGEIIEKTFKNYIQNKSRSAVQKDSCANCKYLKTMESNLKQYGVEHSLQRESVIERRLHTNKERFGSSSPLGNEKILEKARNTSLNKYGKEYYMQTEEYKEQVIKTNLINYGTEYAFQAEEIKQKIKETLLDRYGVEYISQSLKIQKKIKQTNIDKYGVDHIFKVPHIAEEAMRKSKKTMYLNGTAPVSNPQKYIHNVLGGELNYPVGNCSLDIAFPQEKIYVEYDGSGHKLSIIFNTLTEEEYERREIKRYYFLKNRGWKNIRIISEKDFLPNEENLQKCFQYAKQQCIENVLNWVELNIDEEKIKTRQTTNDYDFGELLSRYTIKKVVNSQ